MAKAKHIAPVDASRMKAAAAKAATKKGKPPRPPRKPKTVAKPIIPIEEQAQEAMIEEPAPIIDGQEQTITDDILSSGEAKSILGDGPEPKHNFLDIPKAFLSSPSGKWIGGGVLAIIVAILILSLKNCREEHAITTHTTAAAKEVDSAHYYRSRAQALQSDSMRQAKSLAVMAYVNDSLAAHTQETDQRAAQVEDWAHRKVMDAEQRRQYVVDRIKSGGGSNALFDSALNDLYNTIPKK